MKVLVVCLGLKPARHFSLFDQKLLESNFDIKRVVVASTERMKKYKDLIPDAFEQLITNWTPSDQSTFNKIMLFFRTISNKSFRSHSIHWLRFAIFGNENGVLNLKFALTESYRMLYFTIKYLKRPLSTIYKICREGCISSDMIRFRGNDEMMICKVLESEKPDLVIFQSTLSELTLYNILNGLHNLACPFLLIVDSWDNIGTRPILPKEVNRFLVQSIQQILIAEEVYGLQTSQIELFGTPRIPQIREAIDVRRKSFLKIGYLQGLPADDLELNITNLCQAMEVFLHSQGVYTEFDIIIRAYPIKTEKVYSSVFSISKQFGERVKLQNLECSLEDLFKSVDFVVSEITTAGIESACAGLPTVFIASNSQNIYMNGERLLRSFHSIDLEPKGFHVLRGVSLREDVKKLREIIFNYKEPDLSFFVHTDDSSSITSRLIENINAILHK